jgi:hypothetical protein
MRKTPRPFRFVTVHELKEMLGRTAWDERELLLGIEEVPPESIRYHTHSYFLRGRHLVSPYPNDFATWAAVQVRDRVLGEQLAVVDPFDYPDLEALRSEFVTIIDRHLASLQTVPRIVYGEPFHFMRSVVLEIPTEVEARTLREFREALAHVEVGALYFHFFYAVARDRQDANPVRWVEEELGLPDLAAAIRHTSPYFKSLERLRGELVALCDRFLEA